MSEVEATDGAEGATHAPRVKGRSHLFSPRLHMHLLVVVVQNCSCRVMAFVFPRLFAFWCLDIFFLTFGGFLQGAYLLSYAGARDTTDWGDDGGGQVLLGVGTLGTGTFARCRNNIIHHFVFKHRDI